MTLLHHPVLEKICTQGCQHVLHTIDALASHRTVPELDSLPESQRRQILRELEAIMMVYQRSG